MLTLKHFLISILIFSLLTGCAWSTPARGPVPTMVVDSTHTPTPELSPRVTPLQVLPLLDTPNPGASPQSTPTLPQINTGGPMIVYNAQSGDTLGILAKRFGVSASEIISGENINLPQPGILLPPGMLLLIPDVLPGDVSPGEKTIPDSEVVFARSALDFNVADYIAAQNGFLASYRQYLKTYGWTTGAQGVEHTSIDNSLSPRMVLAIIEYESHFTLKHLHMR